MSSEPIIDINMTSAFGTEFECGPEHGLTEEPGAGQCCIGDPSWS